MRTKTKKLSLIGKLGTAALIGSLAFAFASCSSQPPQPEPPQPEPSQPQISGVPNPVVESSPDEIKTKLGFEVQAPDEYQSVAKYSIIDGKTAQLEYAIESGKGPIKVLYRAARTDADDALAISGDHNNYSKVDTITVGDGQQATVRSNEGTGAVSVLWYNPKVVDGGLSASLSVDPVVDAGEVNDIVAFFAAQESKGF
ncbi:MAG: hypothetical protein LBI99_10985 [Propionibacteriaceae bacterium]|nr:hypothetical protein [Propionibacteriaceae bacterium]